MSGASKTQLGALDIGHDIKIGREHGGLACLRMTARARLTRVSNSPGSAAARPWPSTNPRIMLVIRAERTVSHHIADKNAHRLFSDGKDIEEIAADVAGGKVQTEES
jgi:hypothetical protein